MSPETPATPTPVADPDPQVTPPLQLPGRQALRALPIPADLAEVVDVCCRHSRDKSRRYRRFVEEQLKLQYYYRGQWVAYLSTPEGIVVVAAGPPDSDAYSAALAGLSAEERRRAVRYCLDAWAP